MEYVHQEYPKFRHHPSKDSMQVANPDEEATKTPAKAGWVDSKGDAEKAAEAAAEKAAVEKK